MIFGDKVFPSKAVCRNKMGTADGVKIQQTS